MVSSPVTPSVLMISKPVVPPWNDSSKNLVRDIVLGGSGAGYTVLTDGSYQLEGAHVTARPIYKRAGRFAPSLSQNARVVRLLLADGGVDLHHFFFAPNPRTSGVVRLVRRLRRRAAVQTICSVPKSFRGVAQLLFADINVAVSRFSADRLREAGARNVRHIAPAAPALSAVLDPDDRNRLRAAFGLPTDGLILVFAGDYEFSRAAQTIAEAALALRSVSPPITWVFACRPKTDRSRVIGAEIQAELSALARDGRVRFFDEVPRILDLLAASDLVLFPAESTYAKMDLPLVLLEAMALGRPVLVANVPPLNELPVAEAGFTVPPGDGTALAERVRAIAESPDVLERRGRRAAELAVEHYGRERMAQQYVALYRSLL